MRSLLIACIVVVLACPAVSFGESWVFTVRPNVGMQGASFGMVQGQIVLYGGLDILAIGVDVESSDTDWERDYYTGDLYRYHEGEYDVSGSAKLIIPRLGGKYAFSTGTMRPYVFGDLFKSFAFVDVEGKEIDRYYDRDGNLTNIHEDDIALDKDDEELIESLLGVWGLNIGFGAEYRFSEHFGVGGEYALRWFQFSADQDGEDSSTSGGQTYWRENWKQELSGSLKMSYAAAVLNFYFE